MFCRECGTKNNDGANFCVGCGRPLRKATQPTGGQPGAAGLEAGQPQVARPTGGQPEAAGSGAGQPQAGQLTGKKKNKKWIALALVGAAVVLAGTLIVLFATGAFSDGEDEEDDRKAGRVDRHSEESEERGKEGSEKESGSTEESEPEELPAPEDLTVQEYLERDLIPAAGLLDVGQVYEAGYTEEQYGDYYAPRNTYVQGISGIAGYDVRDYDKDGEDELLVLMLKEGTEQIGLPYHTLWVQVYEKDTAGLRLAAETEATYGALGGVDVEHVIFYAKETDSAVYVAEEYTGTNCVCADGTMEGLHVLHYTGSGFVTDLEEGYVGSDFSGMEEQIAAMAADLKALGFTRSAAGLTTELELDEADGLDVIFLADGRNPQLYEQESTMGQYYETQDVAYLGKVVYRFYRSAEDYRKSYQITGYTTQQDDFSVSADDRTIHAYFDRIIFQGTQAYRVDWLNRQVEALEASYRADLSDLDEFLQDMQDFNVDEEWYYQPMTIESVYYDTDGTVSICYGWYWYMGGVVNTGWDCLNYDLKSQTEQTLWEVLGVDHDTALQMVRQALLTEFGDILDQDLELNLYDLDFYVTEDQVVILANPYSFNNQGGRGLSVALSRFMVR